MVLSACSGSLVVPDPAPSGAAASTCTRLIAALPEVNLERGRREVEPGRFGAAWGDPAIVLRCGVAKPPALGNASQCFEVNGVGWFAEPVDGGLLFTTIGRSVFVEVGVPSAYAPEANALVDVAAAVSSSVPVEQPCV